MITVVDQVRPWLTPSSTLANTIQPQVGAHINSSGTGRPMSQPATRTGLRPKRSDSVPAKKLVAAFTAPNATMKVSAAVNAVSPNTRSASSGRTVRSWPIIPPTSALTADEQRELGEVLAQPEPNGPAVVVTRRSRALPVGWRPSRRARRSAPRRRGALRVRACWRAVMARSPCPHISVTGLRTARCSVERCRVRR